MDQSTVLGCWYLLESAKPTFCGLLGSPGIASKFWSTWRFAFNIGALPCRSRSILPSATAFFDLHKRYSSSAASNKASLLARSCCRKCKSTSLPSMATDLFSAEVLAIAGPQTSVVSHFVAQMAAAVQVPLVSFSATDPSLSAYQYPYFIRLTHSDSIQ
eukprot:c9458_g1_i2 orf=1-474(-)